MLLSDGTLYLDCNATTPLAAEVADALDRASRRVFGNASSAHAPGREAKALLESARGSVARMVGCGAEEVTFTSSGTEAAHLAWESALSGATRRRVLISAIEHPCVAVQAPRWGAKGFEVLEVPVGGRGALDLTAMESLLTEDVALVSVMAAHNETGVLQPLEAVGRMARARGALFHTDAVQAVGKVPSPWSEAAPDYLSLSGHKFYGPKGIGALAVRAGSPLRPMLLGGGQERGARASTEPVPLICALAAAADLVPRALAEMRRVEGLRDDMESVLRERLGAVVHGMGAPRLPNTAFFSLPGAGGAELAAALDARGIFVATGSACHSGEGGAPAVLRAMGAGACSGHPLRVSLGKGTTAQDVGRFIDALETIFSR